MTVDDAKGMASGRTVGGRGAAGHAAVGRDASDRAERWKRPESVLVVVHAAGGEVLLLDRADDPSFRQSVTGSLEAGETPAEAARRELREETGLDRVPTDRHERTTFEIRGPWRARYAPDVTHNVEHVFEVRVEKPLDVTLDPTEHVGHAWLPAAEAMAWASSRTNRAAIGRIVGVPDADAVHDGPDGDGDDRRSAP